MELCYGRASGNSARSVYALNEAGVHYAGHLIYTPSGENRSAAYLAVNPTGRVPALVDGGRPAWRMTTTLIFGER